MNFSMYSIRILTLKMKVKDVVDVDENRQTNVPCQCTKIGVLGLAVCSRYFVHFVTDEGTT